MSLESIKSIFEYHKNYFSEGETLSISFRKNQLARLRDLIEKNEKAIHDALKEDLGKSEFEAYVSETGFCILEIDKAIHNIDKLARTKSVSTSLLHFPASSYIKPEPLGTVLIISPWNYPFQLLISPLVGAIAAGNTAILKPSEVAPATSRIVADLIKNHFSNSYISVVEGAVEETQALLDLPFDYIFYTGNEFVGKNRNGKGVQASYSCYIGAGW